MKELKFLSVDEIHDNASDSRLKLYKSCKSIDYLLLLSATPYKSEAAEQNLKLKEWSGDIVYRIGSIGTVLGEGKHIATTPTLAEIQIFIASTMIALSLVVKILKLLNGHDLYIRQQALRTYGAKYKI